MAIRNLTLIFVALALPAQARDLNRQPYPLGERASGMGGAFIAMTGDAVSTWYNPAGLAAVRAPGVSLSASAYQFATENYADEVAVPGFSWDMESTTFSTFPASIVFAVPLGEDTDAVRHTMGFSVLVPDRDRLEGRLQVDPSEFQFEMDALLVVDDVTYWAGPSYAMEAGKVRFGASVFALVHLMQQQANIALKSATATNEGGIQNNYLASVQEVSGVTATVAAQAGVQYLVSDHWTLGLTVRAPTFGQLYSDAKGVAFSSAYYDDPQGNPRVGGENTAYVDRVGLKGDDVTYKLPLQVGVGAAYQDATYAFAVDVTLHAPQARYLRVDAEPSPATAPDGSPIFDAERVFEPDIEHEAQLVVNANIGFEAAVTPDWKLRTGVFTDRTTQDLEFYNANFDDRLEGIASPAVDRYGVTFALGRKSKGTTTSVGLVYTFGTGEAWALSEAFEQGPSKADVTSQLITAVLSGSADF